MFISVFPQTKKANGRHSWRFLLSVLRILFLAISFWQIDAHRYFLSTLGGSCSSRSYLLLNSTSDPLQKTALARYSGAGLLVPAPPPVCGVTLKHHRLSGVWVFTSNWRGLHGMNSKIPPPKHHHPWLWDRSAVIAGAEKKEMRQWPGRKLVHAENSGQQFDPKKKKKKWWVADLQEPIFQFHSFHLRSWKASISSLFSTLAPLTQNQPWVQPLIGSPGP